MISLTKTTTTRTNTSMYLPVHPPADLDCIDRWLMSSTDYSRAPACPLCNAPLITGATGAATAAAPQGSGRQQQRSSTASTQGGPRSQERPRSPAQSAGVHRSQVAEHQQGQGLNSDPRPDIHLHQQRPTHAEPAQDVRQPEAAASEGLRRRTAAAEAAAAAALRRAQQQQQQ
jgi:hypothetical protein